MLEVPFEGLPAACCNLGPSKFVSAKDRVWTRCVFETPILERAVYYRLHNLKQHLPPIECVNLVQSVNKMHQGKDNGTGA